MAGSEHYSECGMTQTVGVKGADAHLRSTVVGDFVDFALENPGLNLNRGLRLRRQIGDLAIDSASR